MSFITEEVVSDESLAAEAADVAAPAPVKKSRSKMTDEERAAKQAEKEAKAAERAAAKAARASAPKVKKERVYAIPRDAAITVLVAENPKRVGSASYERFNGYFADGVATVQDALNAGLTPGDLFHDIGHGFIKVEGYPKAA